MGCSATSYGKINLSWLNKVKLNRVLSHKVVRLSNMASTLRMLIISELLIKM